MSVNQQELATTKLSEVQREELVAEMSPHLLSKFEDIRSFLIDEAISIFKRRHTLGKMVLQITNDPSKYGKRAIEQLSQLLSMDPSMLYNAKLFAERYTEKQLVELVEARNKFGDALTWSHVVQLIRIPDPNQRNKLQQKAIDECLTYQELLKEIQKRKGGKSSRGGRPLAKPSSLDGYITQMDTMSTKWLKCYNEIWCGGDKPINSLAAGIKEEDLNKDRFEQLRSIEDKMSSLSMASEHAARQLHKLRTELTNKLASPPKISEISSDIETEEEKVPPKFEREQYNPDEDDDDYGFGSDEDDDNDEEEIQSVKARKPIKRKI